MIIGWYYLHTDGNLIYKRNLLGTVADIRESPFAVALWPVDSEDRGRAWNILVEAMALNANRTRILELAAKWGCNDVDAAVYANRVGVRLFMDGDAWCATKQNFINLQESFAGFGKTSLEALSELCKALGYKAGKMWNATFPDLVRAEAASEMKR